MVRNVPISRPTVSFNTRFSGAEGGGAIGQAIGQAAKDIAGEAQRYQAKAAETAFIRGQTQLSNEISKIERDNVSDPDSIMRGVQEFSDGFLSEVSDPNVRARYELQISKASQSAISRATSKRKSIINEESKFENLQALGSVQDNVPNIAAGLLSQDQAISLSAAEEFQESMLRVNQLMSSTDTDGGPLFSAEFRSNQINQFKETALVGAATSWLSAQPDKKEALKRLESGELEIRLPNSEGGEDSINVKEAMGPDGIRVIQGEANRQVAQQEAELLDSLEAPLRDQVSNQNNLAGMISDVSIPIDEKIVTLNKMDLEGSIRSDYAAEARRLLNSQRSPASKAKSIPDLEKFQAFADLADDRKALSLKLGGDIDGVNKVTLNNKRLGDYQDYQVKVMKSLNQGKITEGEAKTLTSGMSGAIDEAIQEKRTTGQGFSVFPGIQDVTGAGLNKVDSYLENTGRSGDVSSRKKLLLAFNENLGAFDDRGNYVPTGEYESTGSTSQDEKVVSHAMRLAIQKINNDNFVGIIDDQDPPNQVIRKPLAPDVDKQFSTIDEMEAADLPVGTIVSVGGVVGRVE